MRGVHRTQISSTVMASSGQTETHDSHPRQSAGLTTLVSFSSASSTSAGQTSIHSPHCLHFSSTIFGKYIETPLLSNYESIHNEVCFLQYFKSIAKPDQLVGLFDGEFDLRAIHLAVVGATEPGVMASSATPILHQQTRKSIAESTSKRGTIETCGNSQQDVGMRGVLSDK